MNRTILVPIDISDSELTQRVISHVEAEAKIDDAEVHFLTVIPSLPYYASLGLAYSAELPAMDDLKAEAKLNRPGFPGECFICELRLPDHRFRWK
uniref:universal stress protein n=1 Tax=Escherichia coli TaxID=562 RepID=UPI0021B819D3